MNPEIRVTSKHLSQHVGSTVRLTAKIIKIDWDRATVEAADGGQVGVILQKDMHLEDNYVEIIGTVKDDLTLRALTGINLGSSIDMKSVNALADLFNSSKGAGVLYRA